MLNFILFSYYRILQPIFFTEFEVLEDGHELPKDHYTFQKVVYNGLELYTMPLSIELVSAIHTDSFLFNRNYYIQFVMKVLYTTRY